MLTVQGGLEQIAGVVMIGLGVNAPVSLGLAGKLPCIVLGMCVCVCVMSYCVEACYVEGCIVCCVEGICVKVCMCVLYLGSRKANSSHI